MKVQEVKLRLVGGINNLIDDYFGDNNITDKFINSTLKILVKQNTYKADEILNMFADEDGCIDERMIIEEYSKMLGDGLVFDLRDYIKNDMIKSLIPNKALRINASDLRNIFT